MSVADVMLLQVEAADISPYAGTILLGFNQNKSVNA